MQKYYDKTPTQGSTNPVRSDGLNQQLTQIGSKIGDLTELETTDKTDLVSAVNEVNTVATDTANTVSAHSQALANKAEKSVVGDFENSDAAEYGSNITEVIEYLLTSSGELVYGNIIISDASLSMKEGGSASFTVRLASAPSKRQIVHFAVSDPEKVSISPSRLTFQPEAYNIRQTVTLTSVSDVDSRDDTVVLTATSSGVESVQIYVTVEDTDIITDDLILHLDLANAGDDLTQIYDAAANAYFGFAANKVEQVTKFDNGVGLKTAQFIYPVYAAGDAKTALLAAINSAFSNKEFSVEVCGNAITYTKLNLVTNRGLISLPRSAFDKTSDRAMLGYNIYHDGTVFSSGEGPDFTKGDDWRHITLVYDNDHVKIYEHKELHWEFDVEDCAELTPVTEIFPFNTFGSNQPDSFLTAFRFYGKALTPAEIAHNCDAQIYHLKLFNFSLWADDVELEAGDSLPLRLAHNPVSKVLTDVAYSSDDASVVVNGDMMTAAVQGEAEITATAECDGQSYSTTGNVTVAPLTTEDRNARTIIDIALARVPETIAVGEEYVCQAYGISEVNADRPYPYSYFDSNMVVFTSSNPSVCRVKNGCLFGVSIGTAVITVSDIEGNVSKTFNVSVTAEEVLEYTESEVYYVSASSYDFSDAEHTTLSIISALEDASSGGYKKTVFPYRSYEISPVYGTIYIPTDMIVDFQDSTIQIMASSMSTSGGYTMFRFYNTHLSKLVNAKIYGERFQLSGSYSEGCRSVIINGKSYKSGLENCTISESPGFNISFGNSDRKVTGVLLRDVTAGGLDDTGAEIEAALTYRSGYTGISGIGSDNKLAFGNVQGNGGYTYLSARMFDIFWFDGEHSLISITRHAIQYYRVTKPSNAVYCRIVWNWDSAPTSCDGDFFGIVHAYSYDKPEKCFIRNCILEDNSAAAITGNGGENTVIEHCTFVNNGYTSCAAHINWEDGRMDNIGHILRWNTFSGVGRVNSVWAASLSIHNNIFTKSRLAIEVNTENIRVWLNYFDAARCGIQSKTDGIVMQNYGVNGATLTITPVTNDNTSREHYYKTHEIANSF